MRKYKHILLIFIVFSVFFSFSCDVIGVKEDPQVRFQNSTSDFEIYHGLKFGDAEVLFSDSDTFIPGEVTEYKNTKPGGYTVQAMDKNGYWQTLFPNNISVESGGKYTVVIEGSYYEGTISGSLVTDEAP